jgi:penicillin V acylase-like amidase (Ntn superfamily)
MFIEHNGNIMSFGSYMSLQEAIKPVKTQYGTNIDCSDKKLKSMTNGVKYTFIKTQKLYVCVLIDGSGEVGFGTNENFSENPADYTDSKKNVSSNALKVFGNVFYVLLEMIKKGNYSEIKFNSADAALGRVYDMMVKNKFFLKELEKTGYFLKGSLGGYYFFEK